MLRRDIKNGIVGGVCAGIAKEIDIPVGLLRLGWTATVVFAGSGLILYLLAWLLIQKEDDK